MSNRPVVAALLSVISLAAWAEDSLVYDPASGNYVLTYCCDDQGAVDVVTLEPETKIEPAITSTFRRLSSGVEYGYSIRLSASSRQPLAMYVFDEVLPTSVPSLPANNPTEGALAAYKTASASAAPSGWTSFQRRKNTGKVRVGWRRNLETPFTPGSAQGGFTFTSTHLPGVGVVQLVGDGATWEFGGEGPDHDSPVMGALRTLRRNQHVPRFGAAPLIAISTPYSAPGVLRSLRDHVDQIQQWTLWNGETASAVKALLSEAIGLLEAGGRDPEAVVALGKVKAKLREKFPAIDLANQAEAVPPGVVPLNPVDEIVKLVSDYDRLLAARVVDFDVDDVINRVGTKPVAEAVVPASVPCAATETCSPLLDVDGNFDVTWSATEHPCTIASGKCRSEVKRYVLETATNSSFSNSASLYEGLDTRFSVKGLLAGVYYFRVTAHVQYCDKPISWASYCEDNPDYYDTGSKVYQTSKTQVGAPSGP